MNKIVIVGGGIIGLTLGTLLQEQPDNQVTVISADPILQTNSDVAAALWRPYEAKPQDLAEQFSRVSYQHYFEILYEFEKLKAAKEEEIDPKQNPGIRFIVDLEYFAKNISEQPVWMRIAEEELQKIIKRLEVEQNYSDQYTQKAAKQLLAQINNKQNDIARIVRESPDLKNRPNKHTCVVPLIDSSYYRPWLLSRFKTLNGTIVENCKIDNLDSLSDKYNTIINCAGERARFLCNDEKTQPVYGQVVRIQKKAFGNIDYAIGVEPNPEIDNGKIIITYVIPRHDDCILGGTYEIGQELRYKTPTDIANTQKDILERCAALISAATPTKLAELIINTKSGNRCSRSEMLTQVKCETIDDKQIIKADAVGHGGGGYSVAWGVAEEMSKRLQEQLQLTTVNNYQPARLRN